MYKTVRLDNKYLEQRGTATDDFASCVMVATIYEAHSNPELEEIWFEHNNILFEHAYQDEFRKIIEQKQRLDTFLTNSKLKRIHINYWTDQGPESKIVWQRD